MSKETWYWPEDDEGREQVLRKLSQSEYMRKAIESLEKNQQGLSNSELDEAVGANSNWLTLWIVRQLLALGLIEYEADLFGNPGRYRLTDKGKEVAQQLRRSRAYTTKTEE